MPFILALAEVSIPARAQSAAQPANLTFCSASQGAVRAVIAQRRLAVMVEQIQAGKLEPKSLIQTDDDGIRYPWLCHRHA
jgi:hypothetical protein